MIWKGNQLSTGRDGNAAQGLPWHFQIICIEVQSHNDKDDFETESDEPTDRPCRSANGQKKALAHFSARALLGLRTA